MKNNFPYLSSNLIAAEMCIWGILSIREQNSSYCIVLFSDVGGRLHVDLFQPCDTAKSENILKSHQPSANSFVLFCEIKWYSLTTS